MIEKTEFVAGMGVLAGAFGREVDEAIIRAYYAVLAPKLSTAEFQAAVQRALETETFWPSPAVLLQKVQAEPTDVAEQALQSVSRLIGQYGGVPFVPFAAWDALPAATKRAALAVGGLREIANVSEDRYPSIRKRFVAAYGRTHDALAAGETDARVKRLVSGVAGQIGRSGRDRAAGADRDD